MSSTRQSKEKSMASNGLYNGLTIEEMEEMGESRNAIFQRALAILNSQDGSLDVDENQPQIVSSPITVF